MPSKVQQVFFLAMMASYRALFVLLWGVIQDINSYNNSPDLLYE